MRRDLNNVHCTVVAQEYERRDARDRIEIRKPSTYGDHTMDHWRVLVVDKVRADFEIEIDVEEIAKQLIAKAKRSKSGRAIAMGGLIKVFRRRLKVLGSEEKQNPIPEGWSEVTS